VINIAAVSDLPFFCIMEPEVARVLEASLRRHWPPIVLRGIRSQGKKARGSIMATTKHNLQSLRDEFGALTAEVTRLLEASDQIRG
jgi:hypothetical protein